MGLYLEDIAKVPTDLTFKQCYQRIYDWHKKIGQKMILSLRDPNDKYYQRYQQLMKLLPSPHKASTEDIAYVFMQVQMSLIEWSFQKEDEYGIKIVAYAYHGLLQQYPKGHEDKQYRQDYQASELYKQMEE